MEPTAIPMIWPGDNVRVLDLPSGKPVPDDHAWGGVWRVKRENPKGYGVEQPATSRKGTLPYVLAVKTEDELAPGPVHEMKIPSTVWPGTLLRLTVPMKGYDRDQVFVVIADKLDRVNIAKLGGEQRGRYLRMPRHQLEPVDISIVQIID